MSADITGSQLSLLCKTLGLGMSTTRMARNWLPQIEATDHISDLSVLLEKGLMEVGKGSPIWYMTTPAGKAIAMRHQDQQAGDLARGR